MVTVFYLIEPLRPYLMVFTIFILLFAWYRKFKSQSEQKCDCSVDSKSSFIKSYSFLVILTLFAAFPYYSSVFYQQKEKLNLLVEKNDLQCVNFEINGMTCVLCENHINYSLMKLRGVLKSKSSYGNADLRIEFDKSIISIYEMKIAVNSAGYLINE